MQMGRPTNIRLTTTGNCEILAPAGQPDSILAAVRSGADSVYLGMQQFNARRSAKNFDFDQLEEAVKFCRLNGVRVYLTLNTLVFDSEFEAVIDCIQAGCELGVDAFIVQDLGVARLVKRLAPQTPLHGSTQMSIHTPAGAQFLKEQGFKRAVLAREMTLSEIKEISDRVDIELETFVHGALCMCVSGQCYLSGMIGGRSANRGSCAQPCRLPFSAGQPGRCDLSLKDLSAVERVNDLLAAGVCSLKIEGRMKRPEYVAAAVKACRDSLAGDFPDMQALQAVFSRSGFTDGYLDGRIGSQMFGMRGKEDVTAASPALLKQIQNGYHKPVARVGLALRFSVCAGQPCALTLDDGVREVRVEGAQPERALNAPLDEERVKRSLFKFGGTVFEINQCEIVVENGLSLPVSELNRMRREAAEKLTEMRSTLQPKLFCPPIEDNFAFEKQQMSGLRAEFDRYDQIPIGFDGLFEMIAVDLDELVSNLPQLDTLKEKLMILPPRGMFGTEDRVAEKFQQLKQKGLKHLLVNNLAQARLGKQLGFELHGGHNLNISNTKSIKRLQEYEFTDCVLSPELNLAQIRELGGGMGKGGLVYGHLPLMLTRNCPIQNVKNCVECGKKSQLTDRKGMTFRVVCRGGCSEIFNPAPIWMADRLDEMKNIRFGVMKFTYESRQEVEIILQKFKQRVKLDDNITRGLYYRGVE